MSLGWLLAVAVAAVSIWMLIARRSGSSSQQSLQHEIVVTDSEYERLDAVAKQSKIFMDASMLMIDKRVLNQATTPKVGACFYLIGAVDFLCKQYRLSNELFLVAARDALRSFGVERPDEFATHISRFGLDPPARAAMAEGGKTIQAWLGSDSNAPIRLFELVQHWVANPESSFD